MTTSRHRRNAAVMKLLLDTDKVNVDLEVKSAHRLLCTKRLGIHSEELSIDLFS